MLQWTLGCMYLFKVWFSLDLCSGMSAEFLFLDFFLMYLSFNWASLVAQMVKHLPAMQETQDWSLGQEDPLETEMATHSSTQKIIALQYCAGFYHTSTWISHRHTYVPSLLVLAKSINILFYTESVLQFLEKGMATPSSILSVESPWSEEPGGLQSMGLQRVRNDWATKHSTAHPSIYWCLLYK